MAQVNKQGKGNAGKQFGTVFRFELANFLKSKVYIGLTLFLIIGLAVLLFLPRVTGGAIGGGKMTAEQFANININDLISEKPKEGTILLRLAKDSEAATTETFEAAFPQNEVRVTEDDDETIRAAVKNGDALCAFLMRGPTEYTYMVNNLTMYDARPITADEALRDLYITSELAARGVEVEDARNIVTAEITHEVENIGKDQQRNFFYTYIMIFALYMVILIYGQIVAGSVASEKTSRAMELLITSARAKALMFGKIFSAGVAGLIQLAAIFGAALLFYRVNAAHWSGSEAVSSMFNIPTHLLVFLLVFFVLGYFLYACLFGAFGSTVSKTEDVQMATMPAMFGVIIMFMVVIISVSSGKVDNMLLKVCSFVPFTSPMAMFARIAMSNVPAWQIALSIGILVATVYGIGVLAARIYRMGVLLYGNAMKPGAVLKALTTSEKAK